MRERERERKLEFTHVYSLVDWSSAPRSENPSRQSTAKLLKCSQVCTREIAGCTVPATQARRRTMRRATTAFSLGRLHRSNRINDRKSSCNHWEKALASPLFLNFCLLDNVSIRNGGSAVCNAPREARSFVPSFIIFRCKHSGKGIVLAMTCGRDANFNKHRVVVRVESRSN